MNSLLLHQLQSDSRLVDLHLKEQDDVWGVIKGVGSNLIVVAVLHHGAFSGFSVLAISDIESVRWGTHGLEGWALTEGFDSIRKCKTPRLELTGWREAITSIAATQRVLSILRENVDASGVYVITEPRVEGDHVVARDIQPDGIIEGDLAFAIEDITRIDFGGPYERGLQRMIELRGTKTT
jgi:hypothetical protein